MTTDPILTVAVSPYITAQGEPIRRDGDAATVRVGQNQTATGEDCRIMQKGHPMTDAPAQLLPTVWIMRTANGWYPIQPSTLCKPEDHGALNPHVLTIEDADGQTIWRRFQA